MDDGPVKAPETNRADFEREGLLEGCEGEARAERIAVLESLFERGVALEEVKGAIAEDRLPMLASERALVGEGSYTLHELADAAAVPLDFLRDSRRAMGLAVPNADERLFAEADVDMARTIWGFVAMGAPREQVLNSVRVVGRGLSHAAHSIRELLAAAWFRSGVSEQTLATRAVEAAEQLLPLAGPMLQNMLRWHLLEQIRQEQITMGQVRAAGSELPGNHHIAVCFADLVGFTGLGEQATVDRVGEVATALEQLAGEVIAPPVQIVKTIGDAVMLVSFETEALVEAALRLVERAEARSRSGFPPLRAGITCGTAVNRSGDWYGRAVNLASRVTGAAPAGVVACTSEVSDAVGEHYRFIPLGERRLKGIEDPVLLFKAERVTAGMED